MVGRSDAGLQTPGVRAEIVPPSKPCPNITPTRADTTALPFECCALSMAPFEVRPRYHDGQLASALFKRRLFLAQTPVCTPDGVVYDLLNVVPFIRKHHADPVTGKALSGKQLTRLTMSKNAEGKWQCPVLGKAFSSTSHVVAIRTTGRVYSYEAVKALNLKPRTYTDLTDGTPFDPEADIITLQNPADPDCAALRQVGSFKYLKGSAQPPRQGSEEASPHFMGQRVGASGLAPRGAIKDTLEAVAAAAPAIAQSAKRARDMVQATASETQKDRQKLLKALGMTSTAGGHASTGDMAASFTSSSRGPVTQQGVTALSADELLAQRWKAVSKAGSSAFVSVHVKGHGDLNLQLHCSKAPATCDNFLTLAQRGYYDGTVFHRLIPGFMVQGGDPTGTGTGGESAWGGTFQDEIHPRLRHHGRGIVSMANSGPGTNGSQFFITFASAPHLDGKHTVFGEVVGGLAALESIEAAPVSSADTPKRPIVISGVTVYKSPFPATEARQSDS